MAFVVFNYRQGSDVIVIVNGASFASCQTLSNLGVLASGSDRITLTEAGHKWYISGVSSHCGYGQKLRITVHPRAISLAPPPKPKPLFPFPPSPPTLALIAEPLGASWSWAWPLLPVPASSPLSFSSSSSSSSMLASHVATPVYPSPLPPSTPVFSFPWPHTLLSRPPRINRDFCFHSLFLSLCCRPLRKPWVFRFHGLFLSLLHLRLLHHLLQLLT